MTFSVRYFTGDIPHGDVFERAMETIRKGYGLDVATNPLGSLMTLPLVSAATATAEARLCLGDRTGMGPKAEVVGREAGWGGGGRGGRFRTEDGRGGGRGESRLEPGRGFTRRHGGRGGND